MKLFDLKPSPRVLVVLTHTAMKPVDALCELVDNAIDSFAGSSGDSPGINEIKIDLPTLTELQQDTGAIRVSDNGPGMTAEEAEKALTAGHSSQNAYDRLGMFGMGLNIAVGKFARKTRLITATRNSDKAVSVEVDLDELVKQGHYQVQPSEVDKSGHFGERGSGTIIELTGWWRQGSPNSDNPKRLIQHGPGKIREILGRRYASLLRPDSPSRFKMVVKDDACTPFEHCVWSKERFVVRGSSQYPACQVFDEVLQTQIRCLECGELADRNECPVDSSHSVGSVAERVRGWIGVQRYDDTSHFGIDLIRNGRAIRTLEKDAFFQFTNEVGEVVKDYPIDSVYGRIVGEVHLDHVRVDFTKQDFDRSTPEWQRAVEYLRGTSSLQTKQPGSSENHSPVMQIFRGYRRVRNVGLGDMYMGEWQAGDKKAQRVSRDLEVDFLRRFNNNEPGYRDDAKWWEKVEEASQEPDDFNPCPECDFQNPATEEICGGCECLLKSKDCINCGEKIPQSAPSCGHCGKLQVPEGPWECKICGRKNSPDYDECQGCGKSKGAVNVFSKDVLLENSWEEDGLSVQGVEVNLPGGEQSQRFDLETRGASLRSNGMHLPAVVYPNSAERKLQIFLDKTHPVFSLFQLTPEHAVSAEAAAFIHAESMSISSGPRKHEHNLAVLQAKLLEKYWRNELSDDSEQVRRDMLSLLDEVCAKMADNMQDMAGEIFDGMSTSETTAMVNSMKEAGVDIADMGALKKNGRFLLYVPPETVISVFRDYPGRFFDKTVWKAPWNIPGLPEENVKVEQKQLKETRLNCLEDGVGFLRYKNPPLVVIRRARLSIESLQRDMAD